MEILKREVDIGLVAKDKDATSAFYRDILGLKQGKSIPLGDGVVQDRLFIGRNTIKINSVPNVSEQMEGGMKNAIGIRLLALFFEDLNLIIQNLEAADINHSGLIDFPGAKLLFIKDPDGNLLELVQANDFDPNSTDRIQVGLCVNDSERSRNFYKDILNFIEDKPIDMGDGSLRYGFRGGNTLIKFWQGDDQLPVFSGEHFGKIGLRYFTYTIDDVDNAHQHLIDKDVKIMEEPFDVDGVAKVLLFADPDDNCIEFVEYY